MQTAEGSKKDTGEEGQGDGQKHRQELVDHVFADLKEGMAADPHFVKGMCGLGLCDQILEAELEMRVELVRVPVATRVHVLLGIRVVDAAAVAVGVVGHEELHVGLLGLQPHRGWRCRSGSGRCGPEVYD